MRTLGTILVALAVLIAAAGILQVIGPTLQNAGINVSGSLDPWPLWVGVGAVALVAGLALWRRPAADGGAVPEAEAGAGGDREPGGTP